MEIATHFMDKETSSVYEKWEFCNYSYYALVTYIESHDNKRYSQ